MQQMTEDVINLKLSELMVGKLKEQDNLAPTLGGGHQHCSQSSEHQALLFNSVQEQVQP